MFVGLQKAHTGTRYHRQRNLASLLLRPLSDRWLFFFLCRCTLPVDNPARNRYREDWSLLSCTRLFLTALFNTPVRKVHATWILSGVCHALLAVWIFSLPASKPVVPPPIITVEITYSDPVEEPDVPAPPLTETPALPMTPAPTADSAPQVATTPAEVIAVPAPLSTVTPEPTPLSPDMISESERMRYEEELSMKPAPKVTPMPPTSTPKKNSVNPYEVALETPGAKVCGKSDRDGNARSDDK